MRNDQRGLALQVLALGGPVAVGVVVAGAIAVGVGVSGRAGHADVWVVVGALGILLGYTEWALARRFAAHEVVEYRQYERVASIADDAAQAAVMMTRAAREQVQAVEQFREASSQQRRELEELAARVILIEQRIMRAGFIPAAHKVDREKL